MTHELKTWSSYYLDVVNRIKRFEIRKNDRNFQVGDFLILQEYNPYTESYTGSEVSAQITYMTGFAQQEGYVVLGIELI